MKRFYFAALTLGALALAGCSSIGSPAQVAEKADTAASDAYVAIATSLNAYESVTGANVAAAEALKLKAWNALNTERSVYAATGAVDLSALTGILGQVKTLTGH